jgi:hypothetical protein
MPYPKNRKRTAKTGRELKAIAGRLVRELNKEVGNILAETGSRAKMQRNGSSNRFVAFNLFGQIISIAVLLSKESSEMHGILIKLSFLDLN